MRSVWFRSRSLATAVGVAALALFVATSTLLAQQMPRFRAGANLVRVDAYVTTDGKAVTDLTIDDVEVLEDGVPQKVESFELIQPRGPAPASALREPNTVAESRAMARDPAARLFVIFMDTGNVQIEGSYHAKAPIMMLLNRAIGEDDLIGVMTPDMSARQLTFARRPQTIGGIFKNSWDWGQRGRVNAVDPRDEMLRRCYGFDGIGEELVRRRREQQTLDALDGLIVHLEGIREERKFVLLLSEGWRLGGPDMRLTASGNAPGPGTIGIDPGGRLRTDPDRGQGASDACQRERSQLAFLDLTSMFQTMLLPARCARPRGVRLADRARRAATALDRCRELARAPRCIADDRGQHGRRGHSQHERDVARHRAHAAGHRRVLPARVLLDELAARWPVSPIDRAGETPGHGRPRASRLPRADKR
jgi:hypothetical protein